MSLASRFWAKVEKQAECWIWTASTNGRGYGQLGRGGRGDGYVYAHRYSWELSNGSIPNGMSVLHRCDQSRCVNPDHLFLGTQKDNMRDASRKGRLAVGTRVCGEATGTAKLTALDIRIIRRLSGRLLQREIAEMFHIAQTNVSMIVQRHSWRHIT
jgi:hypothetical protein